MPHARPATAGDIPALRALSEKARAELGGQRGGALLVNSAGAAALEDMVAATSGRQDRLVVVGTTDEAEVGFLSAHCERTRHQLIGVIDAIYVEPSARLVGVGDAMINLVVEWCAGRGCAGVDAPALPGSRPAKAFFEGHRFVTRLLIMHHPISPSDG